MGIHGEPGAKREKLQTADQISERMASDILADLGAMSGDNLVVMVNGLGATPPRNFTSCIASSIRLSAIRECACTGLMLANTHVDGNGRCVVLDHESG